MQTVLSILAFLQAAGAIVGAGGSVLSELFYYRAIRDGRVTGAEREVLDFNANTLTLAMIVLLLSTVGMAVVDFLIGSATQPAVTAPYWVEVTIVLVVIASSWGLMRRRLPHWLGFAAIFTGWWYLALLTLGQVPPASYGASLAVYVIGTAIIAGLLSYFRSFYPKVS